jgi:LPXTG-motif cell wall-anchored protein
MEFDEGLGIFLWVLVVVAVIVVIVNYRKGKIGLAMTAGFILLGIGIAGDVPLPTVAPGLAYLHSKAPLLTFLGLLLVLGSWLATRRSKRED